MLSEPSLLATGLTTGYGTLIALLAVIGVSLVLGAVAQKAVDRGSFMQGYFLGNRGLGAWALALTATVQSGGTFMGFPSYVYSYGWIAALWISSYMVVPITGFAILGKRFAQLSRRTGSVTVPDLLAARFDSDAVRLVSSLMIMFFMTLLMVAQFKGGGLIMKLAWPSSAVIPGLNDDGLYHAGLIVFTLAVVGYTLIGGFLASVWTDLFQSVLMAIGIMVLFFLVVPFGSQDEMRRITEVSVEHRGPQYMFGPGPLEKPDNPPSEENDFFLPIGTALSMFVLWIFGGVGAPAGLVRLMACKDTATMRRSIVMLSIYNWLIYIPLIIICITARSKMPDVAQTDEIMPRLAIWSAKDWPGGSLISGLILAAPFGAVMATVSTYLVVIASGVVRDIYQRLLHPNAGSEELKRVSYAAMIALGAIGIAANWWPIDYLQKLIVLSAGTTASAFFVPAIMAAFWRKATAAGAIASMLVGAATMWLLFSMNTVCTFCGYPLRPHAEQLLGLHPVVWGILASIAAGWGVSKLTSPPSESLVSRLFDAPK